MLRLVFILPSYLLTGLIALLRFIDNQNMLMKLFNAGIFNPWGLLVLTKVLLDMK